MPNPRAKQIEAAMKGYLSTKHETPAEKKARFQAAARRKRFGRKVGRE